MTTITPDQNVEIVRSYTDAWLAGDFDTAVTFLADDVILVVPGRNPLSGKYHGKEEAVGFLSRVRELTQGTMRFQIRDVLVSDEHVAMLFTPQASRSDRQWNASRAVYVTRIADGKIEEVTGYHEDLYAFDAFMS